MDNFRKRASARQCREHRWLVRKSTQPRSNKQAVSNAVSNDISNAVTSPTTTANGGSNKTPTSKQQQQRAEEPSASTSSSLELDVTKDNLRLFVERWREHPDSPYSIDNNGAFERQSSQETISLRGQSPSPCGSICSSSDSQSPDATASGGGGGGSGNGSYQIPVPDLAFALERRASEGGRGLERAKIDPASQILLAEEIIRLSEHLRSIAVAAPNKQPTKSNEQDQVTAAKINFKSNQQQQQQQQQQQRKITHPKGAKERASANETMRKAENQMNEISEKLSNIAKQRKINGTSFNGSRNLDKYNNVNSETTAATNFYSLRRKSSVSNDPSIAGGTMISNSNNKSTSAEEPRRREIDLTPPWRQGRMKRRFGETCRDVPRIATLQDLHKTMNLDEPTSAKNLLLQLIDEWGEMRRPVGGRKSISLDWCTEDAVARKSINSLAEYVQSEQQKVNPLTSSATRTAKINR